MMVVIVVGICRLVRCKPSFREMQDQKSQNDRDRNRLHAPGHGFVLIENRWDKVKEHQTQHESGCETQNNMGPIPNSNCEESAERRSNRGQGS